MLRYLWLLLVLLAVPCWADEEEAVAALKTSGVNVGKIRSGGYIVSIADPDVSIERFKRIKELPSVREVILDWDKNLAGQLAVVAAIGTVEVLVIRAPACTNDDLKAIGKMRTLKTLSVGSNRITDAGLKHLHDLTSLRSASFGQGVTRAGKESLNDALPKCVVR